MPRRGWSPAPSRTRSSANCWPATSKTDRTPPPRWPEQLRPALSTTGFATELRNLLARCSERGVDPTELERLGRRRRRPEWTAAGQFARQYEQVMLLRAAVGMAAPQATAPALGAAELVGAALEAFAVDPELLAAERARVRVLLIDDAQQLDPQAARLIRVLAAGTELALVAGDPNQAVFGFRGGEPAGLLTEDGPVGHLDGVAPLRAGRRARGQRRGAPIARRQRRQAHRRHRERGRIGHRAPGRVGARRGGDDRRRAAACPPHRRGAVVADGGDRPLGGTGRLAAAACPGRRRGAGGPTRVRGPAVRRTRGARAAHGSGRDR